MGALVLDENVKHKANNVERNLQSYRKGAFGEGRDIESSRSKKMEDV